MRIARGARMQVILGASLIATTLPITAVAGKSDSGVSAITGGSSQAITGGSAAAITGGSSQAITGGSAAAITGGSLLAGPIQAIDMVNRLFLAVGQEVRFAESGVDFLQVGDYVAVRGSILSAGVIHAESIDILAGRYIPGASEVFVTGIPSSIDYNLGTAKIGELTVDYTSSMAGDGFDGIGAAISVIGTQPALGGVMLGSRVIDQTELFLAN